ncbi:hypothetical protein C0J45_2550, partial [Silurus meridionalis]
MFLLCLLTFIVLKALTGEAEVVDDFNTCSEYFYQHTEPSGMDQNAKKICQMLENEGYYYATLYSVHHKIPLYSAYTLDPKCLTTDQQRSTFPWHIEPQVIEPYMDLESDFNKNIIKRKQAISNDYSATGYDRGHLNPNSFQCDRQATFTLTNVAPMDACFNRIQWKNSESSLRRLLMDQLKEDKDAVVYLVTGTVPNPNSTIPKRENSEDSQRVTVPSHIWTAVCYKHNTKDEKSFSFGYIGKNQPEISIIPMSVSNLNTKLSELYSSSSQVSIKIFVDDCFAGNVKSENAVKMFVTKLPEYQRLQMTTDVLNTFNAGKRVSDSNIDSPQYEVTGISTKIRSNSLHSYSTMAEEMKNMGSACLITTAKKRMFNAEKSELRKRDVSERSESVDCQLVPEKSVAGWQTAADGSLCQKVSDTSFGCKCTTKSDTRPCCSSPCLYRKEQKSYLCYSGPRLIQCSPQYSLITYKGERCKDNYPCATYGYDYYWCWKDSGSWDYCSPPLWQSKAKDGNYCRNNHACAKYGKSKPYCYTDYDNDEKPCCISDDCFSAVNGKICKPHYPCGYHGHKYLWCYTTDDSWDYCCKNCGH